MKKLTILVVLIISVFFASCGNNKTQQAKKVEISIEKENYQPGEKDALIVLKAFADEDLETLKSYAGYAQRLQMNSHGEEYFKTFRDVSEFRKKISTWKGSFDDIRYYKDEINFQEFYYLVAVFYEDPETGQLTAVSLKSVDKEKWGLTGFGTTYPKKETFADMSTELPD